MSWTTGEAYAFCPRLGRFVPGALAGDAVLLELAVEGLEMDPEQTGGLGLLTLRPLEHSQDVAALHLDEREVWRVDLCQGLLGRPDVVGEVIGADDRRRAEDQ